MAYLDILLPTFVALGSHLIFRKREPDPLQFIGFIGLTSSSIFFSLLFLGYCTQDCYLTIIKAVLIYTTSLILSILIYRHSPWHPLARFPGPAAAISTKWWMVHRILVKGGRHLELQRLHDKHGKWVRVGPNELSVCDPAAIRPIYNQLERAPFYEGTPAKADSLITVRDRLRHTERRHIWSKAVTGSAIKDYEPFAMNRAKQLLSCIAKEDVVNMDKWLYLFFMDLMGDMGFQGGFETMKAGKDEEGWMDMLTLGVIFVSAMGQVPWLKRIIQLLPQRGPVESFHTFTKEKVNEIRAQQSSGVLRKDILSSLLDESIGKIRLSDEEAAADASLIVVAATDTSVQAVITFLRYPGFRASRVSGCVYTRVSSDYPPGPFGPPRTTGRNGAFILDTWVPPNTTLHVPVYAVHRDPRYFGILSNKWIPERWIPENNDVDLKPCNRDAFVPFSSGYSSCVGKHLALRNIKILLAYLLKAYDIYPSPSFDVDIYDQSFKEYGLWSHDPLLVQVKLRDSSLE
ncbi:cytochrome P450 [Pyrrhoderma noxium]|uniref:Cytochrome P450 n=1 Tax=Pyrrhoderma noxium TaxID=2282107 RepID=A0A286UTC1_9AGAM|nr:cytochrome P450 [Pyrrhoderma noxium]